jgi:2-oxoisovalerate dehydrogenase E2 component (dihydrolipoyl transacylase)
MGQYVFKLPDVGEGTAEVEIVKWHAGVNDEVREEQPLVEIMTDKATVEIAAPVSGRIISRQAEEGSRAAVGSELVVFEVATSPPNEHPEPDVAVQPAAVQPTAVQPTSVPTQSKGKVLASPAVRARAKALGIDLAAVSGSGPDGRIGHADLDNLLRHATAPVVSKSVVVPKDETVEEKVVGVRRRIAERLADAKRRIPHYAYIEEVDVTSLEALRHDLNASLPTRSHLTLLPFLIRALAINLASHPSVNAHFDDAQGVIRKFSALHVGIATQTDRGLLVPVVRNAETKDLWQLATEISRLVAATRASKANSEELTGSTITLSSLGALGGIAATPIINPPEVAIIGVNKIAERPVVRNGAIAVRQMMNLSSSFDHRIIDGYEAASFIKAVKDSLEMPAVLVATPSMVG